VYIDAGNVSNWRDAAFGAGRLMRDGRVGCAGLGVAARTISGQWVESAKRERSDGLGSHLGKGRPHGRGVVPGDVLLKLEARR